MAQPQTAKVQSAAGRVSARPRASAYGSRLIDAAKKLENRFSILHFTKPPKNCIMIYYEING